MFEPSSPPLQVGTGLFINYSQGAPLTVRQSVRVIGKNKFVPSSFSNHERFHIELGRQPPGKLLGLSLRGELSDLHSVAPPRRKLNRHDSHVRVRPFELLRERLGIGLLDKRGDLDPEKAPYPWAPLV